jgi:DNA-binding NarL/FixJ family response regulator
LDAAGEGEAAASWSGSVTDKFPWEKAREVCTDKELDVLIYLAAGSNVRQTARLLGLARSTVKDRRDSAYRKINEAQEEAA